MQSIFYRENHFEVAIAIKNIKKTHTEYFQSRIAKMLTLHGLFLLLIYLHTEKYLMFFDN